MPFSEGGLGIPVVLVLVEGGYDAINDTHTSLARRVPVVICEGTGRAADILAFAYNRHTYVTKDGRYGRWKCELDCNCILMSLWSSYHN